MKAELSEELQDLLVCPSCYGHLDWAQNSIHCESCARTYAIIDGIPFMLIDRRAIEPDARDSVHSNGHKTQQSEFYNSQTAEEFEITRPHGTSPLYRWLLGEKFRHSTVGLEKLLAGATALTVCGGSGMDAECLARRGVRVIASDLSLGAAKRTRERARRYGVTITPVVADVERLPFRNRSVDIVYVHDGLHHLEDPFVGLNEMARVAAHAVSVTEPAKAAITEIAVRFGLAEAVEEAGNRVARVVMGEVVDTLQQHGFRVAHAQRYAMYYQHEPGVLSRFFSLPFVFSVTVLGWKIITSATGRWGNKVVVVAVR